MTCDDINYFNNTINFKSMVASHDSWVVVFKKMKGFILEWIGYILEYIWYRY